MATAYFKPDLNKDEKSVPSGRVYRQLFEAQVQLGKAYDQVKDKLTQPQIKVRREGIPLVKESRASRGHGFLTSDAREWMNKLENDPYSGNPIYKKQLQELENMRKVVVKHADDIDDVCFLPEEVEAVSKNSNISIRLEQQRKKSIKCMPRLVEFLKKNKFLKNIRSRHDETLEDLMHEIANLNLDLEPKIEEAGRLVLEKLDEDNLEIEVLIKQLREDKMIRESNYWDFEDIRTRLLQHADRRKRFIDEMDSSLQIVEEERTKKMSSILKTYSEVLFKICYLPRPALEKLLNEEMQNINFQILANKSSYAELYAKLITLDAEREKNQILYLESRRGEWKNICLTKEIESFDKFVHSLTMLNPENAQNLQDELRIEQKKINDNRVGLIDALRTFKPPESNKTAVYNWNNTLNGYNKLLETINSNYMKKLRVNFEIVMQKLMDDIDKRIKRLLKNSIISEEETRDILETRLLPLSGQKQKEFEEYIDLVERNLEEANQLTSTEVYNLFKYLQGIAHAWDLHETGLAKRERSLQELLQDCRRDHDIENQKREEKLDAILDQMRESSNEKDLKRLLQYALSQLDTIKEGYLKFHETQRNIVAQYPSMVGHELTKYEEYVFKFFALSKKKPKRQSVVSNDTGEASLSESKNSIFGGGETIRNILKEVLNSQRGTIFYVITRPKSEADDDIDVNGQVQNNELLALDELIPNTKIEFLKELKNMPYLEYSFVAIELYKEIKDVIRMNFINHYETWMDDATKRAKTIVAAKYDEIDKELELRLHLHEPRSRRAEMDVHNVRAAELIMHEERVERHCKGVEETIAQIQVRYEEMQNRLVEQASQYKEDTSNLEILFVHATKSLRLLSLQEKLMRDRDAHMDNVKGTIRTYRTKFDETLQYLRNSNAKFRKSFNVFSEGGNFSVEEIDVYKKKLERMALLIDKNETLLLKEMEKLEKKQLDEATKIMLAFQDKFKYNLVDLEFIERVSRWLNETQVKIKIEVAASNRDAKQLFELTHQFDVLIDACEYPHPDKKQANMSDLTKMFNKISELLYERASYLKCFKEDSVANYHSDKRASLVTIHDGQLPLQVQSQPLSGPKTGIKSSNEDPAVSMMKNIMQKSDEQTGEAQTNEQTLVKFSPNKKVTADGKRLSSIAKKTSESIRSQRRAKTRDEMYAYYCTFGEEKNQGDDFITQIMNILRESLEGILTNAELFYRDVQVASRLITRPQSIKETFPDFADAIIQKLKSYLQQSKVYHNQSLKEYRESVEKFEHLSSRMPGVLFRDLFLKDSNALHGEANSKRKQINNDIKELEIERNLHEKSLKPSLGHPSNVSTLEELNQNELKRQEKHRNVIETHVNGLKELVDTQAVAFHKQLTKNVEAYLLKFDEILTIDDISKHVIKPEKHDTGELLRRKIAGLPLEDPDPEPLIKRGQGKWLLPSQFEINSKANVSNEHQIQILTAKTTLAHNATIQISTKFHEQFFEILKEQMSLISQQQNELESDLSRYKLKWSNSINSIKKIHDL